MSEGLAFGLAGMAMGVLLGFLTATLFTRDVDPRIAYACRVYEGKLGEPEPGRGICSGIAARYHHALVGRGE